jgi:hypothetical protein
VPTDRVCLCAPQITTRQLLVCRRLAAPTAAGEDNGDDGTSASAADSKRQQAQRRHNRYGRLPKADAADAIGDDRTGPYDEQPRTHARALAPLPLPLQDASARGDGRSQTEERHVPQSACAINAAPTRAVIDVDEAFDG